MNGLTISDIAFNKTDLESMAAIFREVDLNRLTHEEVVADYTEWSKKANPKLSAFKIDMKVFLSRVASFIYKNGVHDNIKDSLKMNKATETIPEMRWRDAKDILDFNKGRKTMVLRYVVGLMKVLAGSKALDNLLTTHANKYDLVELLEKISVEWRFFGANLHPTIPPKESQAYLEFQKNVITLSGSKSVKKP